MSHLKAIILTLFCALLGSTGQLFFKLGSNKISGNIASWITNWRIITGLLLYFLSAIIFVMALKNGKLSILYPVIATSYIWVTFISKYFLKEHVNFYNWVGVVVIIIGVVLITWKGGIN